MSLEVRREVKFGDIVLGLTSILKVFKSMGLFEITAGTWYIQKMEMVLKLYIPRIADVVGALPISP